MSASKKKQARREATLAQANTLTEKQKQELKEAKAHKRNVILGSVAGAVVAILVIILLVWHSGVIARHTTALTVHGESYSVADMDYYYHQAMNATYSNQQYYAQLYAQMGVEYTGNMFDPKTDPRDQIVDPEAEEPQTYHQYFLDAAKQSVAQATALYNAGKAAGYTLSEDAQKELDEVPTNLDTQVKEANFSSRSAYLKAVYGRAMTEKIYFTNVEKTIYANDYSNTTTGAMGDYSDDELTAYYDENPNDLDTYSYSAAYFDGTVASTKDEESGETVEPTDEEKEAAMSEAKKKADALLAAIKAGPADDADDQTETDPETQLTSFFYTTAQSNGYTGGTARTSLGSSLNTMPYADWMKDSARKLGDVDLFESEGNGYYVVQYLSRARDDTPTVDVRHILLATELQDDPATEDVDERLDTTNETVIAKRAEAQAILDEYLAGDKTAEAFGALADEHSEDGRDSEGKLSKAGGLYTNVHTGDMVTNFNDWCFDESRKDGDTGLVLTEYGWHIMYFQAKHDPSWKTQAASSKKSADQTAWMESVQEGYEATEAGGFAQVGSN